VTSLNHVQLQYIVLKALAEASSLADVTVVSQYDGTKLSLPMDNGTQRAFITVAIEDMKMCSECDQEILSPRYQQTTHDRCEKAKEKATMLEKAIKPKTNAELAIEAAVSTS
jgi:hypothetical protein